MKQYLSTILLATLAGGEMQALDNLQIPRLVVNITIDQLRTDYMEQFMPNYVDGGFKKLLSQGCVYESVSYPFAPTDRASAIATLATGATPQYHAISGGKWLDRKTLRPIDCTDDDRYVTSPQRLMTSTIGDELKVATHGAGMVYAVAADKDAAVLSGGHAADGAFWINERYNRWDTSTYYPSASLKWIKAYVNVQRQMLGNEGVTLLATACVNDHAMGRDDNTDYLAVTYSACVKDMSNWQTEVETLYRQLDTTLADFISKIEGSVGTDRVLFVLTGTGCNDDAPADYENYRVPTGTFYINRTANLLNMYLSAVYGQAHYVEACYHNQIYLNHQLMEQRGMKWNEVMSRSCEFLLQSAGVAGAKPSPYKTSISGDIVVEVAPGWQLLNEENLEQFTSRLTCIPFPIIFYGAGIKPQRVSTSVSADRVAPTIAHSIHIRAPNACATTPLP